MAVEEQSKIVVGMATCLHNYTESLPFWDDFGWLACDSVHTGRGLGLALSAAVTSRFTEAGYRKIGLHAEYYRLPAIKICVKLGFLLMLKWVIQLSCGVRHARSLVAVNLKGQDYRFGAQQCPPVDGFVIHVEWVSSEASEG